MVIISSNFIIKSVSSTFDSKFKSHGVDWSHGVLCAWRKPPTRQENWQLSHLRNSVLNRIQTLAVRGDVIMNWISHAPWPPSESKSHGFESCCDLRQGNWFLISIDICWNTHIGYEFQRNFEVMYIYALLLTMSTWVR